MNTYRVQSEYDQLNSVILGTAEEFVQGERINFGMQKYYGTKNAPTKNALKLEYENLESILTENKVKVYKPTPSKSVPHQETSASLLAILL